MSRVITLSLTFFHLLFAKHFFDCCGIRQICFTYIIISMPTITSNSVQTSLPLLAERKPLLACLTMWMPISVHFRKLRTGQHQNVLTAGPKVIRLSFLNFSHPMQLMETYYALLYHKHQAGVNCSFHFDEGVYQNPSCPFQSFMLQTLA